MDQEDVLKVLNDYMERDDPFAGIEGILLEAPGQQSSPPFDPSAPFPILTRDQLDDMVAGRFLRLIPAPQYANNRMPVRQNVVCNAYLGRPVDLLWLLRTFEQTDYRFQQFPAASYRQRPPGAAVGLVLRVFSNGKITALGAATAEETELGLQDLRRTLCAFSPLKFTMTPVFTSNIVASFSLTYYVKIAEVNYEDVGGFTFIPDLFPGIIYRNINPKVTLLVFETGSVMILGARSYAAILLAVEKIDQVLQPYKVDRDPADGDDFRPNPRRGLKGRKPVGPDGLTDDQRKLVAQAFKDDPELLQKQLRLDDLKNLASAVKLKRQQVIAAMTRSHVRDQRHFGELFDQFYADIVQRERAKRANDSKRRPTSATKAATAAAAAAAAASSSAATQAPPSKRSRTTPEDVALAGEPIIAEDIRDIDDILNTDINAIK